MLGIGIIIFISQLAPQLGSNIRSDVHSAAFDSIIGFDMGSSDSLFIAIPIIVG